MDSKNIVFIAQSLDGYIAGKKGELDWLHSIPNPEKDDLGFTQLMQDVDAIVMGRLTFETVCGFGGEWPYSKPVFVLSKTLQEVPSRFKSKVSLLQGNPSEVLAKVHARKFFRLYIDGGTTIQSFLKEDLIDELRITTIPILLGGGSSLFGDLVSVVDFVHIESKVFLGQLVQSHYKRKR